MTDQLPTYQVLQAFEATIKPLEGTLLDCDALQIAPGTIEAWVQRGFVREVTPATAGRALRRHPVGAMRKTKPNPQATRRETKTTSPKKSTPKKSTAKRTPKKPAPTFEPTTAGTEN